MIDFLRVTPKKRVVRISRKKTGVIYSNPKVLAKMIFYVADIVLIGGIGYLVYLVTPLTGVLLAYAQSSKDPKVIANAESAEIQKAAETVQEPVSQAVPERFKITIPKIKADTWVVTNVSPFDIKEYNKVLADNVIAQASGSGLPGDGLGSSVYMFAHSSEPIASALRTNPVFYLLGEMNNDDKIIADYNGKKYVYKVYDKKVISANDIDYLTYSDPSREVAILQTCWPIGTNWKRLLVFGELVKE